MTDEEWEALFNALKQPMMSGSSGWVVVGQVTVNELWETARDAAHYFDKLYYHEIGIKY